MFRLLEIELRKLLPSRDFWTSITAYVALMPAVFVSLDLFNIAPPGSATGFNLYDFPDVWHNIAYVAQWVNYLLYVVVLQIVTHEYHLRTIRQNIIDGMSRWEYLSGKLLLLAVLALGSILLVAVLALTGGLFMSDTRDRGHVLSGVEYLGLYGLQLFGYLSLALMVGTWVRKTGLAILIFIGYTLMAEALLRMLVLPREVSRYLPSHVLDRLVVNPFFGYVGMGAPAPVDPVLVALSGAYILVFVLCSGWLLVKQDL